MNKRRASTVLIRSHCLAGSTNPGKNAPEQPHVGIWWARGGLIVAILQSLDRAERSGSFLDSTLTHIEEWPSTSCWFNCSGGSDYFVVPRGRVLLERQSSGGLIYHGNETNAATLRRIAKAFNLQQWRAEMDEHYLMGVEVDRLFDEGM